jgi:multiple sugar transport system substrate-binding protein
MKKFAGTKLNLAAETDQYVEGFRALIPKFKEATGIEIVMEELGYVDMRQKATADFVAKTGNYDLMTVDIVWSGEYGANKWTVDLAPLIERDKAELAYDDILPVMWTLGSWESGQWAYPLAGYANLLVYRKDLFDAAGIKETPKTLEEFKAVADQLTKADGSLFGVGLLGAKGPAVAQDFMAFVQQNGGSLLAADGKTFELNSATNVEALEYFGSLFKAAPPGATGWWWGDRNDAFNTGKIAMLQNWSTAVKNFNDPKISPYPDKIGTAFAPLGKNQTKYGFGGWGIGINADSKNQEAAWMFIKWLSSPDVQKQWIDNNGSPIRKSTLTDPEMVAKYPWFPVMLESYEKGDGDYRPRQPWYSKLEDILGTQVNAFLVGQISAKDALDAAQKAAEADIKL